MGRAAAFFVIALFAGAVATASAATINTTGTIVADGTRDFQGSGFGVVLPVLTLHTNTNENGGVGFDGTADFAFEGSATATTFTTSTPESGDVVLGSPHSQTYTFAQLAAAGISNSSNLGIIFNVGETGSNPDLFLQDVRLQVWSNTGQLLLSTGLCTTGTHACPGNFAVTGQGGQGGDGYLMTLNFGGGVIDFTTNSNFRVGLWASATNTDDGNDDFYFQSVVCNPQTDDCGPHPIPEPASLLLLGSGLFSGAAAMYRRRRAAKAAI